MKNNLLTSKPASSAVLRKGLMILLSFNAVEDNLSLSELARKVELPVATTNRILKALCETRFLERNEKTKRYELGSQCYYLGAVARRSGTLRKLALPIMRDLRDTFLETVILYVRDGANRVYYEQVEGPKTIKRLIEPGTKVPIWVGSAGRCFMAYMSQEEIDSVTPAVRRISRNTITDIPRLLQEIQNTRIMGYAVSCSEREEGVWSVSVPIFNGPDSVCAVLTVTGPEWRLNEELTEKIITGVKASAGSLSRKLQGLGT